MKDGEVGIIWKPEFEKILTKWGLGKLFSKAGNEKMEDDTWSKSGHANYAISIFFWAHFSRSTPSDLLPQLSCLTLQTLETPLPIFHHHLLFSMQWVQFERQIHLLFQVALRKWSQLLHFCHSIHFQPCRMSIHHSGFSHIPNNKHGVLS